MAHRRTLLGPEKYHSQGISGSFYSSGPANAIDAISVASVEKYALPSSRAALVGLSTPSLIYPLQTVNVIGAEHEPILYFAWYPFNVTDDLPLYALSNDTKIEDDGCSELPDDTPDLSKFVVLVRRGTCPFVCPNRHQASKYGLTRSPSFSKQKSIISLRRMQPRPFSTSKLLVSIALHF